MRVIMLGPPGSGKGTQAVLVAKAQGAVHLSVGALLRAEMRAQSELGVRVADAVASGDLVPFSDVLEVLTAPLLHATDDGGWVLDGAPRTVEQAEALGAMLERLHAVPHVAIAIEVPTDELLSRLTKRAALEHRLDDTAEVIDHRLVDWREHSPAVLDWFARHGLLRSVDGTGDSAQVAARVQDVISSLWSP